MRVVLKRPAYDGQTWFPAGLAETWMDGVELPKSARLADAGETSDSVLKKPKKSEQKALSEIAQKTRAELEKEITAKVEAEMKAKDDEIAALKAQLEPAKDDKKVKI